MFRLFIRTFSKSRDIAINKVKWHSKKIDKPPTPSIIKFPTSLVGSLQFIEKCEDENDLKQPFLRLE